MKDVTIDITPKWWPPHDPAERWEVAAARQSAFGWSLYMMTCAGGRLAAALSEAAMVWFIRGKIQLEFPPWHGHDLPALRSALLDRLESPDVRREVIGTS